MMERVMKLATAVLTVVLLACVALMTIGLSRNAETLQRIAETTAEATRGR